MFRHILVLDLYAQSLKISSAGITTIRLFFTCRSLNLFPVIQTQPLSHLHDVSIFSPGDGSPSYCDDQQVAPPGDDTDHEMESVSYDPYPYDGFLQRRLKPAVLVSTRLV